MKVQGVSLCSIQFGATSEDNQKAEEQSGTSARRVVQDNDSLQVIAVIQNSLGF